MSVMSQAPAPSIESLAHEAAGGDRALAGVYVDFLHTANAAYRHATDEQKRLMRQLASTTPTPAQALNGINEIMGW